MILSEQLLIEKYMGKCVLVYDVLNHINKVKKCTIKGILKYSRLPKQTLYRWVDDWEKVELIRKDYRKNSKVDRAHFLIVSTPNLENFLKLFRQFVVNCFSK